MASLTGCIRKAGAALQPEDKDAILERFNALTKGGTASAEAARQAIDEQIAAVRALLEPSPGASLSSDDSENQAPKERAEAMAAKGQPVHQDPGEAPEVATKAVVSEAVKTAAENRDRKPSEMRAELLRMVDEAIPNAKDEYLPAWKEPTKARIREAMVSTGLTNESRIVAMLKQQHDNRVAEASDRIGFVDFAVRGDGRFKVLNTVERLKEFRAKVESSPGFKDRPGIPKPDGLVGGEKGYGGASAIAGMIDEGDPQAAVDYAAARGLDVAEVLKGDKARLGKVAGLTPTAEAVGEFEPEVAPEPAAPAQPAAPSASPPAQQAEPRALPPLPVTAYRVEQRYANGAVVRPLPGKTFAPEQVTAIADWFKAAGWEVSTRVPSGISAVNNAGMTFDDVPEPYTAKQRQRDEAAQAADEKAAAKKSEQAAYLGTSPAGAFVTAKFGDALNGFNSTALAKFLDGTESTFGGMLSNRAADALEAMGIAAEGRAVKDILADIKRQYEAAQQAEPSAPAPADDPFAALFGTPAEQEASQRRLVAQQQAERKKQEADRADIERLRQAIAGEKKRAQAEYDDWSSRVYKANKTQVDLPGDGPSNQASMSIGAINESRRRNAMEALTQEMRALDKLDAAMKADGAKVMNDLRETLTKATKIAADGTGLFKTADEQFQYMLLDDLKMRGPGGKGNVTSNGLSKAMLAAIKGDTAAPAPAEPPALRYPATAAGAVQAFNADDAEQAKAIISKLRTKDALREVGEGTGFRMQIGEGVEAFKKRIGEVADRLTKTAREQGARERVLYDKLMDRAMEYDRAADHAARAKANGVADDSTAYIGFYREMGTVFNSGQTQEMRIPEMLERLAADVRSLKDDPDYAKVSAMVREKRPRIFETADKPTLKQRADSMRRKPEGEKAAPAKIGDFGEKLEGARKDYATTLKDAEAVDVAAEPLSKSWPEPDYQKLLDSGVDPYIVALVHAARDEVPTKPQKSWKLNGWVDTVKSLRETARSMLAGDVKAADARRIVNSTTGLIPVRGRAELYEELGHDRSLKGVTFGENFYSFYRGQNNVRKWVVEQKAKATAFSNWPRELAVADTREAALQAFKDKLGTLDLGGRAKGQPQFVIYRKRGQEGAFVGKKIGREYIDLHKAADVAAARAYMQSNAADLEKALEAYKATPFERKTENQPRVGDDHRNGAPVTPEVFAETFGFRGVQFGNYVEQGRRQSDLNEAFDGLMDLAAILGIPPRALSLNGQLGLAFGARGKGGTNAAAAHYEPDKVVINLTKGSGAGSLAHEWWHALDNYFAKKGESTGFVTGGAKADALREQMRAAFEAVKRGTSGMAYQQRARELDKRRSKPYWNTPEERSARAFESYVIAKLQDQGVSNDYLANVVSEQFWNASEALRAGMFSEGENKPTYPYPLPSELPGVRAGFDEFFKTVETSTDDAGNVALFSRSGQNAGFDERGADEDADQEQERAEPVQRVRDLVRDQGALQQPERAGLQPLRRRGDQDAPGLGERLSGVPGVPGAEAERSALGGQDRQRQGLRAGQRPLGNYDGAAAQPDQQQAPDRGRRDTDAGRVGGAFGSLGRDDLQALAGGQDAGGGRQRARATEAADDAGTQRRDDDGGTVGETGWPRKRFGSEALESWVARRASAGPSVKAPISRGELESLVDGLNREAGGIIQIADRPSSLPPSLYRLVRSMGAADAVRGLYDPATGLVWLIRSNLFSRTEAQFVAFHELYGHVGMRAFLGDGYFLQMRTLRQANPALAREADAWFSRYGEDEIAARVAAGFAPLKARQMVNALAVEEALADRAGDAPELKGWKMLMAALQRGLRRLGLGSVADMLEGMTEAETLDLLVQARRTVQAGQNLRAVDTAPAMSRRTDQTIQRGTEADARAAGFTLKAYRGVSKASPFNDTGTTWLTTSREVAEAYAEEVMGYDDPAVLEVMVKPDDLPRHDASMLTDEQREALGADGFGNPQAVGIYDRSDDHPLGGSRRNVTVIHAPKAAVWMVDDAAPAMPAFSRRTSQDILNTGALRDVIPPGVQEWITDRTTSQRGFNRIWHRTVGTQLHKAKTNKEFGRAYYAVQDYMKDVSRMATLAADLAPDMLPQIETLGDLAKLAPTLASPAAYKQRKADIKAASDALFDGTLRYTRDESGEAVKVDADSDELGGIVWTPAELKARGLSGEQRENGTWTGAIGLYQQSRAAINQSLDNMLAADLYRQISVMDPEMVASDPGDYAGLMNGLRRAASSDTPRDTINQLQAAIRTRLGAIQTALDGQPNQHTPGLMQRRQDLRKVQEMIGEKVQRIEDLKDAGYTPLMRFGPYAVDVVNAQGRRVYFGMYESQAEANKAARNFRGDGLKVTQSVMPQKQFEALQGVSPETAILFAEMLGVEKNEAMQTWLKNAVAEQSALKRHIRRKGIEGFDDDGGRVLAAFLTSNARAASRALHSQRISDAVENISQGDVQDEARALAEYVNNPKEEAQAIRSLLFVQYIGGSIASAIVNLTQTFAQTFPYLSQYGGGIKAGQRVGAAMKLALADKIPDAKLAAALARAERDGVVKPQEVFQLQAEASRSLGSNLYVRSILSAWGSMFQLAEQFNRRVAFIAAYNTAVEQKIADPFAFAENAVDETQSVFNKGNRPNWSRGAVGATLFTFKTFTIQYVEFLKRLATAGEPGSPERAAGQKAAALALMSIMVMAGSSGLPFADDLDDLIDTVAQGLGYNWTTKLQRDRFLDNLLGETFSGILQHGLSGVPGVPFDVSQRLGMANLLPGTGLLKQSEANKQNQVLEVFGVAGSAVRDATQGQFLPIAIRNLMIGLDTYETGMYRDRRGRNVTEADPLDAALKAIGLQPSVVARAQRDIGMQIEARNLYRAVKEEITDAWAQAQFQGDAEGVKKARDAMRKWNESNPDSRIIVLPQTIQQRVRQMRLSKADRTVANTPRPLRASTAEALQ